MKKIMVFYHNDCPDGFGAAYAAWKKFGSKAEYIPAQHQVPPPTNIKGKKLYLLDFTYYGEDLKRLIKNNDVTILDHHVSAKKTIETAPNYRYGVNNSGVGLAWKFFHPNKPIPWLLRHIEDRDLWKFKLKNTKEITAAADLSPFDFKLWNQMAKELQSPANQKKYITIGKAVIEYQNQTIANLIRNVEIAKFEKHRVGIINSPILHSELGHAICKKGFLIAIVWSRKKNQIQVSLRSESEKIDVSKLASKYGGGGHKLAAGFRIPTNKNLPWKYD